MRENIDDLVGFINYDYRRRTHHYLNYMKLQSLLYIAQGLSLCVCHQPLFNDDIIAAQPLGGPQVASVRAKYGKYYDKLPSSIKGSKTFRNKVYNLPDWNVSKILKETMDNFCQYNWTRLLLLTLSNNHNQKSPYYTAHSMFPDDNSNIPSVIEKDAIQKWFSHA